MPENTSSTLYAVSRDGNVVSDTYDDVSTAQRQLDHLTASMTELGLEPDLELVTISVKTTYGAPKTYKAPTPDAAVDETPEGETPDPES